ncbi:hypothetical protein ACQKM9_20070 [Viridibacillus sp. NPDC093762]
MFKAFSSDQLLVAGEAAGSNLAKVESLIVMIISEAELYEMIFNNPDIV